MDDDDAFADEDDGGDGRDTGNETDDVRHHFIGSDGSPPPTKPQLEALRADYNSRRSMFGEQDPRTCASKRIWEEKRDSYHAAQPPESRLRGLNNLIRSKEQRKKNKDRKLEVLDRRLDSAEAAIRAAEDARDKIFQEREATRAERQALEAEIEKAKEERAKAYQEAANPTTAAAPAGSRQAPVEPEALDTVLAMFDGHPQRDAVATVIHALRMGVLQAAPPHPPTHLPHACETGVEARTCTPRGGGDGRIRHLRVWT